MTGTPLVNFADFVKATAERKITAPTDIINEAVKRTYSMRDMLVGRQEGEVVQGGATITDRIQFSAGGQFGYYDPNEQFDVAIEDTLSKLTAPWRFCKDAWSWTDHEVMLNAQGGGDAAVQYVNLRDSKRQACVVSMYNGMEDALWATPSNSLMESQTTAGGRPYSIRSFVTEDGLAPAGFSTLMGIDPSAQSRWRNQVSNYPYASIDSTLIPAMEDMWVRLKFEAPESKDNYFRETKFKKLKIYTDRQGRNKYVQLTRQSNDDASPDLGWANDSPTFSGIPVKYVEAIDDIAYATGQPRFFFLNFEYLFPVFHSTRYMYETPPIQGGSRQPYSWVVYKDSWYNLFCRSRYRQGMVVPI